jgi:hypothetical protein
MVDDTHGVYTESSLDVFRKAKSALRPYILIRTRSIMALITHQAPFNVTHMFPSSVNVNLHDMSTSLYRGCAVYSNEWMVSHYVVISTYEI